MGCVKQLTDGEDGELGPGVQQVLDIQLQADQGQGQGRQGGGGAHHQVTAPPSSILNQK